VGDPGEAFYVILDGRAKVVALRLLRTIAGRVRELEASPSD
jgi:hypothetical protein